MMAKMRNNGEASSAAVRIFVESGIAEAFSARLTTAMGALTVGPGSDRSVNVGPLVNDATPTTVTRLVTDALANGAPLEPGGQTPEGPGFSYPPTVLTGVSSDAEILHTEIFGPLAPFRGRQ